MDYMKVKTGPVSLNAEKFVYTTSVLERIYRIVTTAAASTFLLVSSRAATSLHNGEAQAAALL